MKQRVWTILVKKIAKHEYVCLRKRMWNTMMWPVGSPPPHNIHCSKYMCHRSISHRPRSGLVSSNLCSRRGSTSIRARYGRRSHNHTPRITTNSREWSIRNHAASRKKAYGLLQPRSGQANIHQSHWNLIFSRSPCHVDRKPYSWP